MIRPYTVTTAYFLIPLHAQAQRRVYRVVVPGPLCFDIYFSESDHTIEDSK